MEEMSFTDYLISKKIDPEKFKQGDQARFESFKTLFEQVHPKSFTAQKLFLINQIRRTYHLVKDEK